MKRCLFLLLFFVGTAYSQEDAWVYFTPKTNTAAYFSNPLQMLSQRAINRRAAQNIPIDALDVPILQANIDQIDNAPGITVMAKSKWLNAVHVRGSVTDINLLGELPIVDHVDFADNSLDAAGRSANRPSAAKVSLHSQVAYPYGQSANQVEMLNGHLLHQQDYTGTGKWIAVLDAGFPEVDAVQPFGRLRDNNLILGGYNFVDRNADFYSRNSHGTLVLSTMGGYTAGQLVGSAPDASYYLFITEDTNSENPVEESYWVEAAEMADSLGVDIINSSLGYFTFDDPAYSYSYPDLNGVTAFASRGADIAFSRGMIVVASAGNTGAGPNPNINVPADAINVLTVGAVNAAGNYASFSSIGPSADGRVKPDIVAQGQSAVFANTSGNISTGNGTSFSAPIISGMVASLWQALPNKTNSEIVQLIKQSAHLYSNPNNQLGYGIPNFSAALGNGLSVAEFIQYPNPVQRFFTIAIPAGIETASVALYSLTGAKVLEIQVSSHNSEVNVEALPSGVYVYTVKAGVHISSGKIIKQ